MGVLNWSENEGRSLGKREKVMMLVGEGEGKGLWQRQGNEDKSRWEGLPMRREGGKE